MWIVLGIEAEDGIVELRRLQAADVDGGPAVALLHLHLRGGVAGLVDGDVHLLDVALLVGGRQVYLVAVALGWSWYS